LGCGWGQVEQPLGIGKKRANEIGRVFKYEKKYHVLAMEERRVHAPCEKKNNLYRGSWPLKETKSQETIMEDWEALG